MSVSENNQQREAEMRGECKGLEREECDRGKGRDEKAWGGG